MSQKSGFFLFTERHIVKTKLIKIRPQQCNYAGAQKLGKLRIYATQEEACH